MSGKRTNLELIAPTIDEAIQNGLDELGLSRNDVDIEILDEGNRGLFGLGTRQARVRLTLKNVDQDINQSNISDNDIDEQYEPEPIEPQHDEPEPEPEEIEIPADLSAESIIPSAEELMEDLTLQVVRETILDLLERMNFEAEVNLRYGEPDEMRTRPPIMADIQGEDLSMLIGRRAETLNALQYITSLIVSKELGRYVTIVIDVEGYRERRYSQVRQLANRMAEQALKTGRRQMLEPMPANERRIVHIELRENPDVRTESIGEDPYRKVTIIPE
jgi:spoIIIJ-associated protein